MKWINKENIFAELWCYKEESYYLDEVIILDYKNSNTGTYSSVSCLWR